MLIAGDQVVDAGGSHECDQVIVLGVASDGDGSGTPGWRSASYAICSTICRASHIRVAWVWRNACAVTHGARIRAFATEQKPVEIRTPRDRDGSFEPQIVRKRQRRFEGFDEKILALYSRGLSTRDMPRTCRKSKVLRSDGT